MSIFSVNFSAEQHAWLLATFRHLCMLGRFHLDPAIDGCGDVISALANSQLSQASGEKSMSEDSELYVECRRQCAYNFPVSCNRFSLTPRDPNLSNHIAGNHQFLHG